jgi:hypothetical protein
LRGRGSSPPAPICAWEQLEWCGTCYLQGSPDRASATSRSAPMPEPACRWNLAPGLDQRGRVAPDHDMVIGQMRTNRDLAEALGSKVRPAASQASFPPVRPISMVAGERCSSHQRTSLSTTGLASKTRTRHGATASGSSCPP